jgi:hypothetical protein
VDGHQVSIALFCIVFLFAFGGLLALAGSTPELLVTTVPKPYVPGLNDWQIKVTGGNLSNFEDYVLFLLNDSEVSTNGFSIGGRNLRLQANHNLPTTPTLLLTHRYGLGLAWEEDLDWFNELGTLRSWHNLVGRSMIGTTELDVDYATFHHLNYTCKCLGFGSGSSAFSVTAWLYFDEGTYSSPSDAWASGALNLIVGIGFNEVAPGNFNVWAFIWDLLTFNTINVFGTNSPEALFLNALIVACIAVPFAFIAISLIAEYIPF